MISKIHLNEPSTVSIDFRGVFAISHNLFRSTKNKLIDKIYPITKILDRFIVRFTFCFFDTFVGWNNKKGAIVETS